MQMLQNIYPLQPETLAAIQSKLHWQTLDKGALLIPSESVCDKLFLLEKGSIKSYHIHEEKEHTTWVYFEGELLTSWHSYMLQIPSIEWFKANEKSTVASLSRVDVEHLKYAYPDFVHLLNSYYEFSIGFYDHFMKRQPTLSAIDNYKFILDNYPKLIQRASNSDIASIIGVTRETVSRIRTQL